MLVLFGNYANQRLQMADADAAQAIADKWAVDATSWGNNGINSSIEAGLNISPYNYPQSLKDFNSGKPLNTPVPIVSISKALPAVVTVGAADIGRFSNGMTVTIAGVTGTGWTVCNGNKGISGKSGNTFILTGIDTSAATGTAPTATGTVKPPAS